MSTLRKATKTLSAIHPLQSRSSRAVKAIAGPRGRQYLEEYLDTQWWSSERLERYQFSKIRHLLRYAYDNVPYYRKTWADLGVQPDDIRSLEDYRSLPILTKDIVRDHPQALRTTDPSVPAQRAQTGASTGEPLVFWRHANTTDRASALSLRLWGWMGHSPGDPYANLWGLPIVRQPWLRRRYTRLMARQRNEHYLNAFMMGESMAHTFLQRLTEVAPVFLRGYVSALEVLARAQIDARYPIAINAVSTTAEKLLPQQRTLIEQAFGCKVFDQYGCGECLSIAYECEEHSGLHVCVEHCLLEIVDSQGQPVAPNEVGEIVLTDLDNMTMPFIRYKNGDLAQATSEICPCGRGLPLIRDIVGRTADMIQGTDGQRVHGEFFTHLLEQLQWIGRFQVSQYQVVQAADRSIKWKVISKARPSEPDVAKLIQYTRDYLGDLPVAVEFVDEIPTTPTGKRRFTLSELAS